MVPVERLLTVREVAARLRVSTSTVYKLCAEGRLGHVRVANAIRVAPAEILELLGPGEPKRAATSNDEGAARGRRLRKP